MWEAEYTKRFKKDYQRCKKRNLPSAAIESTIRTLLEGKLLPERHRDHPLKGKYAHHRECHIQPDWLLVYQKDEARRILKLVRTGTHSDLFDE
jgi:mRNA interferase YafQ